VGRDREKNIMLLFIFKLQSTRPRGARPAVYGFVLWQCIVSIHAPAWGATVLAGFSSAPGSSFNPRARVGRDRKSRDSSLNGIKFQSTRPRGARQFPNDPNTQYLCFNPRARVGRDAQTISFFKTIICFNPRARVGRDKRLDGGGREIARFQSTRPRGARHSRPFIG